MSIPGTLRHEISDISTNFATRFLRLLRTAQRNFEKRYDGIYERRSQGLVRRRQRRHFKDYLYTYLRKLWKP
jgi:hypothetical protein